MLSAHQACIGSFNRCCKGHCTAVNSRSDELSEPGHRCCIVRFMTLVPYLQLCSARGHIFHSGPVFECNLLRCEERHKALGVLTDASGCCSLLSQCHTTCYGWTCNQERPIGTVPARVV